MKQHLLLCIFSLCLAATAWAQEPDTLTTEEMEQANKPVLFKYRISLRDKKHNPYSLKHPEQFLSYKSIERRRRQHIKLDKTDLPVTPLYLSGIRACGVDIEHCSKWNNTVLVSTPDTSLIASIEALPYVLSTRRVATYREFIPTDQSGRYDLVRQANEKKESENVSNEDLDTKEMLHDIFLNKLKEYASDTPGGQDSLNIAVDFMVQANLQAISKENRENAQKDSLDPVYGVANEQARQLHVDALHQQGFRGQGMTIAVIDGGYFNADIIPMLCNTRVLGTKSFVRKGDNVYEQQTHGMMVLSCMGANNPGQFVGTAPEASYWLLCSEDGNSEQMVEEDNWCAAIEYADSVGADLANTSLGYSNYDTPSDNVLYWEMDGQTRLCSHSASMAAAKGMVLCNSAGNSGSDAWRLITPPADADNALTVGAVNSEGKAAKFSSLGNTADGRIKPDVMARGVNASVLSIAGLPSVADGTSFASPILCGAVACYWQAHPQLTALQVVEAIRALGDNHEHPNNIYGYGIPNFAK